MGPGLATDGPLLNHEGQFQSQYSHELFPTHPHIPTKTSGMFGEFGRGPLQGGMPPDPTMGRTNIPMPLPPGSLPHNAGYTNLDGSSVTLTPLSPPQMNHESLVPGLDMPYPQPYPSVAHSCPQGVPILDVSKGYIPFNPPNGSVAQAFFGTNRLFPENEPFHFKFGGPNLGQPIAGGANPNPNPFHFQQTVPGNSMDSRHRSKHERTRHASSDRGRRDVRDDPQMVVVQR